MRKLLFALLAISLLSACRREEKFSVVPAIEFVSLEKIDDGTGIDKRATLAFSFQDGDGDIGLDAADTTADYKYNCFIDYYRKRDGVFQKVEFEEVSFNQRIPRLSRQANESIHGTIHIDLDINDFDFSRPTDTIRFSLYITDRALHQSNTIETTELVVRKR